MSGDDTVLVWGGGAVGGTVAAYLARAGHPVTLVDRDAAHVAAINEAGLSVRGPEGDFTVRVDAVRPQQLAGRFATVLLAVKAHHTEPAATAIGPHLAAGGAVVSLQNGLCELTLSRVLGREAVVGAFINFGADVTAPGTLLYGNRGAVVVGELDGAARPRTGRLAALLRHFEPEARVTDNIWGYLWGKLAYSALLKASALCDTPLAAFIADAELRALHVALIGEILAVAAADGVRPVGFNGFDPAPFAAGDREGIDRSIAAMAAFNGASAKQHSSTWQDLAVFRRRSDAAAQLAPVFETADRHGVAVPCNRKLIELIGQVEAGRAARGADLVAALCREGAA